MIGVHSVLRWNKYPIYTIHTHMLSCTHIFLFTDYVYICVCMCIHTCILHFANSLSDYRDGATVNKVRHHFDKVFPFPSALYSEAGKLDHTNLCTTFCDGGDDLHPHHV